MLVSIGSEKPLPRLGSGQLLRCFCICFLLAKHPCISGTSGCTHLCLTVPSGYKCDCPAVIDDAQKCSISFVTWPPPPTTPTQPPTTTPTTEAPTTDYCASNPCENGATCETIDGSFLCECEVYFTGITCSLNYGKFNFALFMCAFAHFKQPLNDALKIVLQNCTNYHLSQAIA